MGWLAEESLENHVYIEANLNGKRELITFSMLLMRLTVRPWSRSTATIFVCMTHRRKVKQ